MQSKKYIFIFTIILLIIACYLRLNFIRSFGKLNIILISVDSLRQDHLGCYGYERNTSPNIDAFAKEGVLFSQAIAQGTRTHVSLPSLHTSTYPRVHGCYTYNFKMNPLLPTLSETLKKNGYFTMAVIGSPQINQLKRGFDIFIDNEDMKADEVTRKSAHLIEKYQNNKFFIWVHYFDPHGPYRPPVPYDRIFPYNLEGKVAPINDEWDSGYMGIPLSVAENNITNIDYYVSQYDGEIRFTDEQIGALLKKIKELSLDKNSIFIITSDHGDSLGEHNLYFVHGFVYDEVIKIPLIIKSKKVMPFSKIIGHQVQHIDIAPTILEILRIKKPKTMQGNSLLPLIQGNKGHPSFFSFSECRDQILLGRIIECIRTNEWKLICINEKNKLKYMLYNLKLDPKEDNNLVNLKREEFKFLNEKLVNWRNRVPLFKPTLSNITKEQKEILRSLGYIQ